MIALIENKKVLFITTKRLDYIRNAQELRMLKQYAADYRIVGSNKKTYFFRLAHVYLRLLFTSVKPYDTVLIGFAPQLVLPLFAWKLKKADRVVDFFVSLYDTFCWDRRTVHPAGPLGRLLHFVDAYTLNCADRIICDTDCHGGYLIEEFHADRDRLCRLYLEADPSIYYPMSVAKPAQCRGRKTVLFFGSMLPLQGYEIVLKAFYALKNRPDYCFYLIGPLPDALKNSVQDMTNLFLFGWLTQKELARHIAFSDLCVAGHFSASIKKADRTIPGKAYIYRAMGKPMILGDTSANHELFTPDRNTIFVPAGDSRAITKAILNFFGDSPC